MHFYLFALPCRYSKFDRRIGDRHFHIAGLPLSAFIKVTNKPDIKRQVAFFFEPDIPLVGQRQQKPIELVLKNWAAINSKTLRMFLIAGKPIE